MKTRQKNKIKHEAMQLSDKPNALEFPFFYFRVNNHPGDSLHTYGMVAGLVHCGNNLGATTGPVLSGIIKDVLDFVWALTILSFGCVLMVSPHTSVQMVTLKSRIV